MLFHGHSPIMTLNVASEVLESSCCQLSDSSLYSAKSKGGQIRDLRYGFPHSLAMVDHRCFLPPCLTWPLSIGLMSTVISPHGCHESHIPLLWAGVLSQILYSCPIGWPVGHGRDPPWSPGSVLLYHQTEHSISSGLDSPCPLSGHITTLEQTCPAGIKTLVNWGHSHVASVGGRRCHFLFSTPGGGDILPPAVPASTRSRGWDCLTSTWNRERIMPTGTS